MEKWKKQQEYIVHTLFENVHNILYNGKYVTRKNMEKERMFIKSKWIKYYAKRTIKFTSLFAVGLIIMASIIYIKYKPSYKVTLNGQTIGYVQDKEEMQKMIEDLKNNPGENVADIKFNSLPSYQLEFLSGDLPDDTDKVLVALQNNSTVTYRAYAILLNGKKENS